MAVPERYRDILVIDLLGGLGDLVMVLPVVHALARRHPGAALRLLTHAPGDALVSADPAVTEVRRAARGHEPEAVRAELDRRRPDLVVSTTRYGGIPDEIQARGMRAVTDLWRHPPPDVPVTTRYLQILHAEGLIDAADAATARPVIRLTPQERRAGRTGRPWSRRCSPGAPPPWSSPSPAAASHRPPAPSRSRRPTCAGWPRGSRPSPGAAES